MVYSDLNKINLQFKPWAKEKPSNTGKECHMDLHARINEPRFYASYDRRKTPTDMVNLMSHNYGRIWIQERKDYLRCNREDKAAIAKMRLEIAKKDIKEIAIKAKKRIAENYEMKRKKQTDYYWHRPETGSKNKQKPDQKIKPKKKQ